MKSSIRTAMALLLVAAALVGCDTPALRLPVAPSPVSQVSSPPPPATSGTYTLTPSATAVAPGASLSISWTASPAGGGDWIGLFALEAAPCDHGWSDHTAGAASGTLTLTAPMRPGTYEFRYLPNDGCVVALRSGAVSVTLN